MALLITYFLLTKIEGRNYVFCFKKKKTIPSCSVVIAAGGSSHRMDGVDKLLIQVLGIPIIVHTINAFQICDKVNEVVVVTREECMEQVSDVCAHFKLSKVSKIILGGSNRLASVMNGVLAVSEKADLIAIHDGARPCIDQSVITCTIEAAMHYHAAAPGIPVSSTIKKVKSGYIAETVDRVDLVEIQTPQVFEANLIKAALTNALSKSVDVTDDCKAVELIGAAVYVTEGSKSNIKLTTQEDIKVAESFLTKL